MKALGAVAFIATSLVSAFLFALGLVILWDIGDLEPIFGFDITIVQAYAASCIIALVTLRVEDLYDHKERETAEHVIAFALRQLVVWGSVLYVLALRWVS